MADSFDIVNGRRLDEPAVSAASSDNRPLCQANHLIDLCATHAHAKWPSRWSQLKLS